MINQKNKEKKNKNSLNNSNQYNKPKQNIGVSKLLELAIKKYQFDIVGWTEFCIDNKNLKQKALPIYRQKPFENLRIQDRNLSSFTSPPLKKVYESPESFVQYLNQEYIRDQAFYEAILKNPGKYKADIEDNLLNEEIDKSAKKYIKSIKKRKVDEENVIRSVKTEDWVKIKMSKYPKVQLGLMLGISKEAIINNFGLYFINQLKANFLGTRTAYLSSTGPTSWHEIERCEAELTYFEKMVVEPIIKKLKI